MLARGKYGIEYTPEPSDDESGGSGWVVLVVILVMLVSLAWTFLHRLCSRPDTEPEELTVVQAEVAQSHPTETGDQGDRPTASAVRMAEEPPSEVTPAVAVKPKPAPSKPALDQLAYVKRPVKVRNLLMRLEEAKKTGDVEMQALTIEQLRALPGSPVADLDDTLARQLGELNLRRFFGKRRAWVSEVTVKRGDSASRIAAEHGSTLASFSRLNGGNIEKLKVGQKAYVLDQPRFQLVVRRRAKTADLQLKDRFFKRYDIISSDGGKDGAYETSLPLRQFWRTIGIDFSPADRAELEMLLPKSTPVLVSEM